MDTSEIRYRVADFLKQHPPFNAVDDADLVALAANGRVRFFPNDEFLAWQGEPHKTHVLVIQQGTVSLWDEQGGQAELRDVRGPGDWIGAEQFHGARSCLYTARANTDVVTYGFPGLRRGSAAREVSLRGRVRRGDGVGGQHASRAASTAADPLTTYLQQLAGPLRSCSRQTTVRRGRAAAARERRRGAGGDRRGRRLRRRGDREGAAVVDRRRAPPIRAVPCRPSACILPGFAGPDTSLADGALAMGPVGAVAMTADGTATGRLLTVVTPRDLLPALGDQPAAILGEIAAGRRSAAAARAEPPGPRVRARAPDGRRLHRVDRPFRHAGRRRDPGARRSS